MVISHAQVHHHSPSHPWSSQHTSWFPLLFQFPDLSVHLSRGQASTSTSSPSPSSTSVLNHSPMLRYMESGWIYMRKGLVASTLNTNDFAWSTFAMFCVSIGMPFKPVFLNTVHAFICYCMDARDCKLQYIHGLVTGIQFNVRCYDHNIF